MEGFNVPASLQLQDAEQVQLSVDIDAEIVPRHIHVVGILTASRACVEAEGEIRIHVEDTINTEKAGIQPGANREHEAWVDRTDNGGRSLGTQLGGIEDIHLRAVADGDDVRVGEEQKSSC